MEHQVNDQVQQASLTSSNDIASKIDNVEKEKDKKNCSIPSCNDNDQSARPLNAEGSGNPTNAQPTTASTTTSDDDDEQRNIISLFHHLQHSGNMKLKLNNHHDITEQMNDPSNNHNNGNNNNNKAVRDDNNVVIAKTLANMSMKTIFQPDNLASPKGPFDRTIYSTNAIGVNDDDDTTTINDDALMKSSSKPTLMSITTSLSRKSSSSPRVQLDSDNNDDEDEDDDDDGPIDDEEDEVSDDEGNNDSNNGNGQPQDGGKLWSLEEDNILLQLQSKVGNRWSWIARKLPGRTENQIKTRFKSILRASKRMWTKAEDELLIAKQKQHRNDWVKIAQSFPKRTKNGVRVRFKQLLNIKLGAVEKSTPGSPRQALLSGYDSEIVDRKTWIKTSKLKNNNNNNNNTNSNNISNKSRSHDSDELSSTHSLKKRKLSSHSFASSNHNGKDSSMSPSQNRLNDVLINKVIARTPSSSQDTCDDKRESSSETESIAASATTSCSKSTNASTASSASLNSASSQASYGLVSPFQMLFSGPVTTASPNTTSPKVPQNQNIFLPANITGFINPVALNQPTQILLPVPQSSIPTLAAASVNTVPSGQIPFFAFLPITGANIQGDGANKLMPNMFSQVPLVAFPLNMAPGVNRPSPQLSSAQETNKS